MRRLPLILLAVAALGCGGSTTPPEALLTLPATDANVVGTFHLVTANGASLPIVAVNSATQQANLTADTLVIVADNTWVETSIFNITSLIDGTQGTARSVSSGTYLIANSQINFTTTAGGTNAFAGSVTGNTLSLVFNNKPFVYSR
ncbi:MAG: hypothetical protein JWM41_4506 [Gemmatimonadetes bacterium]|nr:hypothetical protein [Gemmatimonadota bacterium]